MKLAVIPARGGSKRVPRKNVRPFGGKPMIAWSVAAARSSGLFDHVVVSTDDAEIREVAVAAGAEAPFVRPPDLADDHTPTRPVVQHAIRAVEEAYGAADHVCCIYATAPFVTAEDLRRGFDLLSGGDWDYAFSVSGYDYPVQRGFRILPAGGVEMLAPEFRAVRSQDLEPAYHDAAQFYWGRAEAWLADRPVFSARSVPVILPRTRVHDIDTPEDWELAELVFEALRRRG